MRQRSKKCLQFSGQNRQTESLGCSGQLTIRGRGSRVFPFRYAPIMVTLKKDGALCLLLEGPTDARPGSGP